MRKIPLQFSDIDFGTEEFGYIPNIEGEDPDDADTRYIQHLSKQGIRARIDTMGNLVVEGRADRHVDESRLRQMVRREIQALARRR